MTCKWKVFCKQGETCVAHDGYDILRCTAFKDKEVPTTNEEWSRQATTDGMTAIFMQFMFDAEFKARFVNGNFITEFRKWLKEIHE